MKHLPTGIQVFINGRCQKSNKKEALKILTAKVNEYWQDQSHAAYENIHKKQIADRGRGQKIRTYNFMQDRITDHRSNKTVPVDKIMKKGSFQLLV